MPTMTRRQALLGGLACSPLLAQPAVRTNVVLILSDDQGYGDFDFHGNTAIRTPNLRRLAAEGTEFTRFSVSPVCAPTRAALMTGRYPMRTGVHGVTGGRETMRESEFTLGEAFLGAGYRTALFGKWHLGEQWPHTPKAQGFETFKGFLTGHWNRYFNTPVITDNGDSRLNGFITDALTNEAISFIESSRRDPFFLYLAYNVPHSPFQVPEEDFQRHVQRGLPPDLAAVYGMVENLDRNVGRLLDRLDQLQLSGNTVVAFLCDNGPNTNRYNAGLRARKGQIYEGGIRSPLLLRQPGRIKTAQKDDRIAAHIDVYPTLLSLAGVKTLNPLPLDGVDLTGPRRERTLCVHADHRPDPLNPTPGAIWNQRYKLVNRAELYDLENDPGETKDLAAGHPKIVEELKGEYDRWFAGVSQGFVASAPPIPVGYAEENPVHLPATRATLQGDVRFHGKFGYANDFLVANQGTAIWNLSVLSPGTYHVTIEYLSEKGGSISGIEEKMPLPASGPARLKPLPLPNRVELPYESPEMDWILKRTGEVKLESGSQQFALKVEGLLLKSVRLRYTGR